MKIPLKDRAGVVVRWLTEAEAEAMAKSHAGDVVVLRTKRRIRGLKLIGNPEAVHRFVMRRRGMGDSHRRETWENPRGAWHIDRLPSSTRGVFVQVLTDCLISTRESTTERNH